MNNTTKAIVAVVVIVAAAFLLYRQAAGPKAESIDPEAKKEMEAQLDAITKAVQTTATAAIEKAAQSGWDATGAFWVQGRYRQSKPLLDKVFGKSFQASDIQKMVIYRDSESSAQVASFQYQGAGYAFYLTEATPGKYLISQFNTD